QCCAHEQEWEGQSSGDAEDSLRALSLQSQGERDSRPGEAEESNGEDDEEVAHGTGCRVDAQSVGQHKYDYCLSHDSEDIAKQSSKQNRRSVDRRSKHFREEARFYVIHYSGS